MLADVITKTSVALDGCSAAPGEGVGANAEWPGLCPGANAEPVEHDNTVARTPKTVATTASTRGR